jgi:spermidine synthase
MSLPWITLASEPTADGVLELRCRGGVDYLITIAGRILMSSAAHRSEVALAERGTWGLRERRNARVLVSGLGMGFTLQAALKQLAPDARVDVAELNAVVADWCRGPLAPLTASAATDKRVRLHTVDVAEQLAKIAAGPAHEHYDSVLLDMYEGPQPRVSYRHPIYGAEALQRTHTAMKPHGILAVWCEAASSGFERNLELAGFGFKLEKAGRGARIHLVYVAKKQALSTRVVRPQSAQASGSSLRPVDPSAARTRAGKPAAGSPRRRSPAPRKPR